MDVNMPRWDGINATAEIRRFDSRVKILFYSAHPEAAEAALAVGANGFVTKAAPSFTLRAAIQSVLLGGIYVDQIPWAVLRARFSVSAFSSANFNLEQQDVAHLLIQGFTSKEIAAELQKKARRIEKIRAQLMSKVGARNATALVVKLARHFRREKAEK